MNKILCIILMIIMCLSVITLDIIIIKQQERINNIPKEIEVIDIFESEKGVILQLDIEGNVHNYLLED